VLARSEKQLLVWIAGRLPTWITPDHLSLLGLAAMAGVGGAFAAARGWPHVALPLVPLLLAMNWFGDSLDGTLARVRRAERPRYGFYVDHVIDMIGTVLLMTGIAFSGYMSPLMAMAVLVAYLAVSAESYLATHARGVFNMAFLGWGPTELRVLLCLGALWLLRQPWITPFGDTPILLFDVGGIIALVGMTVMFVSVAVRNVVALYREETRR
jgi:phosphatidylglycerophosphate synthase